MKNMWFRKRLLLLLMLFFSNLLQLSAQTSCVTTNRAAGQPVTASTVQSEAGNVVDGDVSTMWQPTTDGDHWLYIDLGRNYSLCHVVLWWTAYHSRDTFEVQFSADTSNWTNMAYNTAPPVAGPTGTSYQSHTIDLSSSTVSGRYVRLYFYNMIAWDAQLQEVQVYTQIPLITPTVSLTAPAANTYFTRGDSIILQAAASETGGAVSSVAFYQGATLLGVDSVAPYSYTWKEVPEGDYTLTATATDTTGYTTGSGAIDIHVEVPPPSWSLTGNGGTNAGSNFIGRTDSSDLIFRTRSLQRLNITAAGSTGIGTTNPLTNLHTTGSLRLAGIAADTTMRRALLVDSTGNLYYENYSPAAPANSLHEGGDSLGINVVVGTKDNNNVDFYTSNQFQGRLTNTGNLLLGTTTDNGAKLQANGGLTVSGSSVLNGIGISSTPVLSMLTTNPGVSILLGSKEAYYGVGPLNGANANSGLGANGLGNIMLMVPRTNAVSIAQVNGNMADNIYVGGIRVGGTLGAVNDTSKNSLVFDMNMTDEPVYNGAILYHNLQSFGGSYGFLRDDNPGGNVWMLNGFTGNIYMGFDRHNWIDSAHMPTGYVQVGTSSHNSLALFGGYHATPPGQSGLSGPSKRPGSYNDHFTSGYFRVGAGRGTGTGNGSDLRLAVAPPGVSGAALNPYVDALAISGTTGYVGIGTTSPQSLLAVKGTMTSKGIVAITTGWPDYVFKPGYPLKDLHELETYIVGHRHLPGIEPAGIIDSHGLDLAKNQAALLAKIEELTLYTIQQEKLLSDRRSRIEKQHRQIEELKDWVRAHM